MQSAAANDEARSSAVPVPDTGMHTSWLILMVSLAASFFATVVSFFLPVVYALPVFDMLAPTGVTLTRWGWWFTPSFSYIGQGMIMGLPTSLSMMMGAVVGWTVLTPLAHHMHWVHSEPLDAEGGGRGWIMWVALAVMCAESIIGVVTLLLTSANRDVVCYWLRLRPPIALPDAVPLSDAPELIEEEVDEPPSRQTPASWIVGGILVSVPMGVCAIAWAVGNRIAPWATLLAFLLASFFAVLAVRALGETDLNPVSGVAKISQLLFGVLQPGNVVANLIAGAITESGAMQAGELMQDYKTGHLIGVAPWNQFRGQLLGSLLGIGFTVYGYSIYRATYPIPGPQFPAPTATIWLNLARLINRGTLPEKVPVFMVLFGLFFSVTGVLHTVARRRRMQRERMLHPGDAPVWEHCAMALPSGIAFATGLMNTPNFSMARLLGGILAAMYARRMRKKPVPGGLESMLVIVVASGFVLGEGFASVTGLLLTQHHIGPLTCYGCRYGCAGGC